MPARFDDPNSIWDDRTTSVWSPSSVQRLNDLINPTVRDTLVARRVLTPAAPRPVVGLAGPLPPFKESPDAL